MKQNLEDIIKEQLENYEAPYDSTAWDQMNDKLDARSIKEQAPNSSSKILKLISLTAVVSVVAILIYNSYSSNEENKTKAQKIEEVKENNAVKAPLNNKNESTEKSEKIKEESVEKNTIVKNEDSSKEHSHENEKDAVIDEELTTEKETTEESESSTDSEVPTIDTPDEKSTNDKRETPVRRKFIIGAVSETKICEGESIIVKNEGHTDEYVRVRYSNTDLTIPSGQQSQLKLDEATDIQFLNDSGEVLSVTDITVYKNPQVDFSVEANIFDKGLPIVNLKAYGSYKSFSWDVNDNTFEGKSAQTHLFNKGTHNATLTVVDHNNCKTSKERSISIESDYNLMAVNGFRPEGSDHRNRTFMPYALTQRDVDFTMVIIDSRDHGVVFKTEDASEPWDGVDQRTGKMTPADRAYIWKVQLDNPKKGENNVYAGTIVHD